MKNQFKFGKKWEMGVMLTLMGVPFMVLAIVVALLLPLVHWIRDLFR